MNDPNVKGPAPRPYGPMLVGALGASVGAAMLLVPVSSDAKHVEFILRPEFLIYASLYCSLVGFFAIVIHPMWKAISELKAEVHKARRAIIWSVLVVGVLFAAPAFLTTKYTPSIVDWPYGFFSARVFLLVALAGLIGLPAAIAVFAVQFSSQITAASVKPNQSTVDRYLSYRAHLHRSLWILGVIIGLGTLATAALRSLGIASELVTADDWPVILLLGNGGYHTVLIGLIYAPAQASLINYGCRLRDGFFPQVSPHNCSWRNVSANREEFDRQLGLSPQRNFQAIAVFVPLLSAVVSILIGET